MRTQRDTGVHPSVRMRRGYPLTVAGLAPTAFPQGTSCRSHVVIATAKLGGTTISGFALMGLGLVDPGDLERKPEVGNLGINPVFSGELAQREEDRKGKGHSCEAEAENPTQATSEALLFERTAYRLLPFTRLKLQRSQ